MTNRLINESSPYLLQHAHNPVDWYPWGDEAFSVAQGENKPVFLSIGYSTCHWCHVMERESFESSHIAGILNENFISVKVDKEERPDVDSVYMQVCTAMTGSGGWPLTILMTPDKKPFFSGTYLPRRKLADLLEMAIEKWHVDESGLYRSADEIIHAIQAHIEGPGLAGADTDALMESAHNMFAQRFDPVNGGFGPAPKFPSPHNLLFLMDYGKGLQMAEKTLLQMYLGGIFDHIGFGFSRYSTDERWLAPHFEKMLYDNALLTMAYARAFTITGKEIYKEVADKTIEYVLRELTHPEGGFYSAQDADIDGEEGKFYLLKPQEIVRCLGTQAGREFNEAYDITERGNFEGKSIPNLLKTRANPRLDGHLPKLREYRQSRFDLHKDDKVLASWNGLMISALAQAGHINAAKRAVQFIESHLMIGDDVFTSWRDGRRSEQGFLDDYACMGFAMVEMYRATGETNYLKRAEALCKRAADLFFDREKGGFRLSGAENEALILDLKETYDGAVPSGNSVMAYNLVSLDMLDAWDDTALLAKHLDFMAASAGNYPAGHSFFLLAMLRERASYYICDENGNCSIRPSTPQHQHAPLV